MNAAAMSELRDRAAMVTTDRDASPLAREMADALLRVIDHGRESAQLTEDRWFSELAEVRDGIADLARRVPPIQSHRELAERVEKLAITSSAYADRFGEVWEAWANMDERLTSWSSTVAQHDRAIVHLRARHRPSRVAELVGVAAATAAAVCGAWWVAIGFGDERCPRP